MSDYIMNSTVFSIVWKFSPYMAVQIHILQYSFAPTGPNQQKLVM